METTESSSILCSETIDHFLNDEQEEWEYEYSATETETYYLTLELSYPEFKGASARVNAHSRAGYYKNWQAASSGVGRPSHRAGHDAAGSSAGVAGSAPVNEMVVDSGDEAGVSVQGGEDADGEDDDDDGDYGDEDDQGIVLDPALRSDKGKQPMRANDFPTLGSNNKGKQPMQANDFPTLEGNNKDKQPMQADDYTTMQGNTPPLSPASGHMSPPRGLLPIKDPDARDNIQILELHSDHPIISYRGRLFEGEWAEIIGTEMLFARHDHKKPLPFLRQVPDDIDVLAAISSRIVTKEKTATPLKQPNDNGPDPLAETRADWNIRIPGTGKGKANERQQQARFLENLIVLKKLKGETDDVTVYATDGHGKDFDDSKNPDYKPRRKRVLVEPYPGAATPIPAGSDGSTGGGGGSRRTRRAMAGARGEKGGRLRAGSLTREESEGHDRGRSATWTPARWEDMDVDDDDVEQRGNEGGDEDDDVSME